MGHGDTAKSQRDPTWRMWVIPAIDAERMRSCGYRIFVRMTKKAVDGCLRIRLAFLMDLIDMPM